MSTDELCPYDISMLQLSDSFFPTGMYAMSSGLEAIYYAKKVKGRDQLRNLLEVYLTRQMGPADSVALSNAYEYANSDFARLLEVDQILFSMKLVEEMRSASTRSGIQLLRCLSSFIKGNQLLEKYLQSIELGQASGVYPVAFAVACNILRIPKEKSCTMMLYSFSVSIIGAALRLGLIDHFDGQRLLHELNPVILQTVKLNLQKPLSSIWQFAPQLDLFQIRHERMNSKMFIS
ncbi:MAG: urease accessory protein UreF [Candidatus Bathyarchaeia archaeon]